MQSKLFRSNQGDCGDEGFLQRHNHRGPLVPTYTGVANHVVPNQSQRGRVVWPCPLGDRECRIDVPGYNFTLEGCVLQGSTWFHILRAAILLDVSFVLQPCVVASLRVAHPTAGQCIGQGFKAVFWRTGAQSMRMKYQYRDLHHKRGLDLPETPSHWGLLGKP
jgi:hypothetical protein